MAGQILERTQRVQLGAETLAAPGTEVTPTHQMDSLGFTLKADIETEETTSSGNWPATLQTTGQDSSSGKFDMPALNYNELPVILASTMVGDDGTGTPIAPVAAGAAGAQDWDYYMDPSNPNPGQTYSLEYGSDVRGQKTTGVIFASHSMNVTPKKASASGGWLGGQLRDTSDGLTPAFTAIQTGLPRLTGAKTPIEAKTFCVYMSTTSRDDLNATPGDFSATNTARRLNVALDYTWTLNGRRENMFAIRCDLNGAPVVTVEGMELSAGSIEHEANDQIMALFQQIRGVGGTRRVWFRLEANGPVIGAGPEAYRFYVDKAVYLRAPEELKVNGKVIAVRWPLVYALDENFGGAGIAGFLASHVRNVQTALLA
jgi:hypothetical protein